MEATQSNVVQEALRRLGGTSKAVAALNGEVSESRWHRWRRAGRINDIDLLPRVAVLTGLSIEMLAGWAPFTGDGGTHPSGPRPVRRQTRLRTMPGVLPGSVGPVAGFAQGMQTRRVLRGSVAM
jgi:hypothetical protein